MEKTTVFNLIILDESGSMDSARKATISGCNEVINAAKSMAQEQAGKERYLMSIYAFQGNSKVPSRYIIKNQPVEKISHINMKDYRPWGSTPLYDAIGTTLTELESIAATHENALGIVTIITDGYENDSRNFTGAQVRNLISRLKELGWSFNFIGANVDVEVMGQNLNIDSRLSYDSTEDGTEDMFSKFKNSWNSFNKQRVEEEAGITDREELLRRRKKLAKGFLDDVF